MELIRGLASIRSQHRGCAATIGNFDGIHTGHAQLIERINESAQSLGVASCVITFEPLPMEYFATLENMPQRLTWLREKWRALSVYQLDQILLLKFDQALATTTPTEFIKRVLVDGLAIKHLLVGDDFRFGQRRLGDISLLREAGHTHGFSVAQAETVDYLGERVSSTRIRMALKSGKLDTAAVLLGRDYELEGHVGYGAQLGRTIGFPTANVSMAGVNPPLRGVFAVSLLLDANEPLQGIANLGEKPTVDGQRLSLEVHLLDYDGNLYGKKVRVVFHKKIRDEKKFNSLEALKAAIAADGASARNWFANRG